MVKSVSFQNAYNEWFSGIHKMQDSTQVMRTKDKLHALKAIILFPITLGFEVANRILSSRVHKPSGEQKAFAETCPRPRDNPVYKGF